jgi:hypothetical protein
VGDAVMSTSASRSRQRWKKSKHRQPRMASESDIEVAGVLKGMDGERKGLQRGDIW